MAIYDGTHPAPGTTSTDRSHYIHPPLTNAPGHRSAADYDQVINQFAVKPNPRYAPGGGNTYCNIFVWDVSRAMGAEVPHWTTGNGAIAVPDAPGSHELLINEGVDWMLHHGVTTHGWNEATPDQAQDAANQGKIAVAMWKNPEGHGHTAIIRPGTVTAKGATTAQAGATNFNLGHIATGFGFLTSSHGSAIRYFLHD